jgi:hypothetical protein
MANPDSNARFLSYDSSKIDLGEKKSTKNNDKTAYHTAAEIASAAGVASSGFTYTEVAITSPQILAKDTITVLPAPGANKYYDIEKVIFEYNYGTIAYVNQNPQGIYLNQGRDFIIVHGDIIEGTQDTVAIARPHAPYNTDVSVGDQQNPIEYFWLNEAVVMDYYDGGTIINGNGTLLLKVWYKIKTFGTEL